MGGISEQAIQERAYHIWLREGRPHGRDHEHWVLAQIELEAEARRSNGAAPKARKAAPRKAPPAAKATVKAKPKAPARKPAKKS